jgi:hypothetical protein
MPARPKTAASAARTVAVKAKPKPGGVFARLKAEAAADRPAVEPYVIDDVEPPIVIHPPDDAESQLAAADLFNSDGSFQMKDARRVVQLLCGDAYERVWELVRREHVSVLLALIDDMGRHFEAQAEAASVEAARDFPGGSGASSS